MYFLQNSDVELDYEDSDEELESKLGKSAESEFYLAYEAQMKMKYTGHRNARYACNSIIKLCIFTKLLSTFTYLKDLIVLQLIC